MTTVNGASRTNEINPVGARPLDVTPATAAPLLAEPGAGGDVGLMIATMIIETAFANRMRAREDRHQATNAMVAAHKDQIAHMREAAEQRYTAAQAEAWGKIADGGLGVVGGCVTAGVFGTNADSATRATNEGYGNALSSGGRIASGFTGLAAAGDRYDSENLDADAKAAENEAMQQKRMIEAADDDIKEAREYTRAAIDFLRELESTKSKSLSSAIKG
jgi:hypothetical protein